jgi:N-acetyl-gamma-glutamyl-phosphate reductase
MATRTDHAPGPAAGVFTPRRDAPPIRAGVAGATGYAGQELVRLLARHPHARVVAAMSSGATDSLRRLPALARLWDGVVSALDVDRLARETDAVFLGLPDAAVPGVARPLLDAGVRVIDLSGAFRLRDATERARWYPASAESTLGAVYGLTEHHRDAIAEARLIACPGCYPTAALLALAPLVQTGLLEGEVVIDAKSGISGAGKSPTEQTHFSECGESVAAYGVFGHRHGIEMAQELGVPVTFVPHLVPLNRGILETIYTRVRAGVSADHIAGALREAYETAPFVRLTGDSLPEIKHVVHTNFCDIGWRLDAQSGRLILVACLDNLLKGAAGQAVQNFNVAFGLDEGAGLLN